MLDNSGTIYDEDSGGGFQIDSGATLENQTGATFDFLADGALGGGGTPGSFTSSGLIEKSSGSGVSSIGVDFSNMGGTIQVNSGTLSIAATGGSSSGGIFTVAAGSTLDLTGGQTVTYAGFYSGSGSGAIALQGGTLAVGTGGATFNFTGPVFQWSDGTIDTTLGKPTNTGTINLTGSSGDSVHLTGTGGSSNLGTIDQSGGATLDLDSPATLNNQSSGVYDFATDASISEDQSGGTFVNSGILEKTGGSGTSSLDSAINFRDTGTVSVQSGTLALGNSAAIITAGSLAGGTWMVAAGSDISLSGNITALGATSTSSSITETVVKVATTVNLSPSANPGFSGQIVTLTATVSSVAPGTAAPVGNVTFKLGKKTLGTAMLSGGKATLGTKKLALGTSKITVVYSGNADFAGNTSAILKQTIKRKPPKKPTKK